MEEEKKIATGYIGNALRSSAADHTTTFTDEIFDTERQKYQNEVNTDLEQAVNYEAQKIIDNGYGEILTDAKETAIKEDFNSIKVRLEPFI